MLGGLFLYGKKYFGKIFSFRIELTACFLVWTREHKIFIFG
jgi:hypothetical protein